MKFRPTQLFHTYSIVARDPQTGQFGVAVQTHQMCVGSVVPWLLPGVGAAATQSLTNISFGPMALAILREGVPAQRVIDALVASDPDAHRRQVAVVDNNGRAAAWTGSGCIPEAAHHVGEGYSVQANMMTNPTVVGAMSAAYETTSGDLAARMLAALQAAQREGGDIRGMQSIAIKIVPGDINKPAWETVYDLRVDEHETPVEEMARLVRLRRAQLIDDEGYHSLKQDQREQALLQWHEARVMAPELEELPFWHALTLADEPADIAGAITILRPMLADDPRREHWIELIRRLNTCGLFERADTADDILKALE